MQSNDLTSIELGTLTTVTGGKHNSSSSVLNEISSLASQIKDVTKKTSGLDSNQLLLLVGLFALNRQNAGSTNLVYVSRGRYW